MIVFYFGTSLSAYKLAGDSFGPATTNLIRFIIATSVLLPRVGDGHPGYGSGSACTDKAITTYLVSGTLPADGTVCR